MTAIAASLAWRSTQIVEHKRTIELLESNGIRYELADDEAYDAWYHSIPNLQTPRPIRSISFGFAQMSNGTFGLVMPDLANCQIEQIYLPGMMSGPPTQKDPYGGRSLDQEHFELIANIKSVKSIDIDGGVSFYALASVKRMKNLKRFACNGSSGYICNEGFEFLLSIPSIETIGDANGGSDELRKRYPHINFEITDFPP